MVSTEKTKPIGYDALIADLIQKIDNEKSLFRVRDYFNALRSFIDNYSCNCLSSSPDLLFFSY